MHKIILLSLLVWASWCRPQTLQAQTEFITDWNTLGTTSITIPTSTAYSYNYTVKLALASAPTTILLTQSGVGGSVTFSGLTSNTDYRIFITGTFPCIFFNNGTQSLKLTAVLRWGTISWKQINFYGCENLDVLASDVPGFALNANCSYMFRDCQNLKGVSANWNWNTTNVTNMSYMFYKATAFNQNIGSWNTSNVTNMNNMFSLASAFNQNIGGWNTANVTNMSSMFYQATAFNQNIGSWNTENVTNTSGMFELATAFNQNIGSWNTANVNDMSYMFFRATAFNQNIGSWNTGNVTNMSSMFYRATAFNQNIGGWNTANVTNMSAMFYQATAFNQAIGSWNTGNVTDMSYMFNQATAFNQNIGSWNTANVTNMSYMLSEATAFNQNIGSWNTGNVTNMSRMFYQASAFNQNIGNWNTANVTNMFFVFYEATAFNQNIGGWNTGNVTNMPYMFYGATAFNQNIGNWNLSKVTNLSNLFTGSGLDCKNYGLTLIGWAANPSTPNNRNLATVSTKYSVSAASARSQLITKGWVISDNGMDDNCIIDWTWNGSAGNDWQTAANWDRALTPPALVNINLPNIVNKPTLSPSDTAVIHSLTILPGGYLLNNGRLQLRSHLTNDGSIGGAGTLVLNGSSPQTITNPLSANTINLDSLVVSANAVSLSGLGKLSVYNKVRFTSGNLSSNGLLVLKSTPSSTARVDALLSGSSITGNVTVERYIPGGRRAYRFFGHPFTAAIPLNQLMVVSGANTGIDITGAGGAANGFTPTNTNASSAYNYTPATGNDAIAVDPGWNAYANTTAALWQSKEGARILIRGTKGEGLDGAPYTPSATTISMSGALNDGSTPVFNLTAGANSEYNFIANPLASQIDMRAVVIGGTVNSNYYVWDVNSAARGAYFNEPFTSAVTYRYLPVGSAFFARTSSSGTIGFPENVKVSNAPATVLKGTSAYGANSIQLVLRDAANIKHDRILFFIDNTASSSLDTKDGEKFTNPGINFYAMSTDNKKLSIDARPFADNTVIPLGLYNVETGGSYVLAADDFNVDDDKDVMLHDKKLNSFTAFTVGMEYPFSVNLADSSSFGNRFELVMKAGTTLPLSELNLVATKQPAGVLISFTTTNETDLARHEVERSLNGKDFEGKTTLAAKNEKFNSYSWTDADVNAATIFYRIKTTAKSGAVSYSRVVKLLLNGRSEVSVYPNPVTGRSVQLQFSNMDKGSYQVKLYGANGQVVMSSTMTHNGGSTVQPLALPHLASGVYNLVLNAGSHRFTTTLIVE